MINLAGLVLVALSMVAAGVWPPPLDVRRSEDNLLVKEGHRVIVVEYEREGIRSPYEQYPKDASAGSVKRAIVDQSSGGAQDTSTAERIGKPLEGFKEELKEKFKETAEVLPNLGQGVPHPPLTEREPIISTDHKESKVCDAVGVCKEKISGVFGAAKDKVAGVRDKLAGKAAETKDAAGKGIKKVVREGEEMVERGKEAGKVAVDKARTEAGKAAEMAKEAKDESFRAGVGGAKRIVDEGLEKAGEAKDKAQHAYGHAKEKVELVKETAKDASGRAEEKVQKVREKIDNAQEIVQEAMDRAKNIAEDGRRNITEIIQRGKEVAQDAASYAVSRESLFSLLSLFHSLAFSVAFGTCFWVTFVSSYVLLRALPRQQFGVVQSKIYPVYFRTMAYAVGVCLLTQFFLQRWPAASRADRLQAYNLLVSLGFVLTNMLYLEPRATKIMYDRLKLEREEGRGRDIADMDRQTESATVFTGGTASDGARVATTTRTLDLEQEAVKSRLVKMNRKLKNLNNYSSLLNMVTLMGLAWHLVYLSQRKTMSCHDE